MKRVHGIAKAKTKRLKVQRRARNMALALNCRCSMRCATIKTDRNVKKNNRGTNYSLLTLKFTIFPRTCRARSCNFVSYRHNSELNPVPNFTTNTRRTIGSLKMSAHIRTLLRQTLRQLFSQARSGNDTLRCIETRPTAGSITLAGLNL